MLNKIIGFFILISIITAAILGRLEELTLALMDGGKAGVNLVLSLIGTMALWQGILRLCEKCGFTQLISKLLYPFLKLIFPNLNRNSDELKYISMNISANMLGVANASTPFGLKAVKEMYKKQKYKELETFVLINTASVQIIPTTAAILRKEYGSLEPFSITALVIIVSFLSLAFSLLIFKCIR